MKETFKEVIGYEGIYSVSNLGQVKSLKRKWVTSEKVLKPQENKNGYLFVNLYKKNKKMKSIKVHKLVASAFLNHKPDGTLNNVINHIDKDKKNNNLLNLEEIRQRKNVVRPDNSSSEFVGVSRHGKKWQASIFHSKKLNYIGLFESEELASEAYQKELKKQLNL